MTEDILWGLTKKTDVTHCFRKKRTICPTSKGQGHGWLFVPRPDWDPTHPLTCKNCLKILEFEERERAGEISRFSIISRL